MITSVTCEVSEVLLLSLLVSFLTLCPLQPTHHKPLWSSWWARRFSPVTSATQSGTGALLLPLHMPKIWEAVPFNNLLWYHLPQEIAGPLRVAHQSCLHKCYISNYCEFARQPWEWQFQTVRNRIFYTLCKKHVKVFPMGCFEAKSYMPKNSMSKFMK